MSAFRKIFLVTLGISCVLAAPVGDYETAATMPLTQVASKCLDGTKAGYYLRLSNSNSDKWVLWLEGGGLCTSTSTCNKRLAEDRGSSSKWASSRVGGSSGDTLLSPSEDANPDYHEWNHVYLPYCSGDVWAGMAKEQTDPWGTGTGFYFQGHLILEGVVQSLRTDHGLGQASEVLLTGTSAGGLGTFSHVDWLADALPGAQVSGVPQAGWFGLPISTCSLVEQSSPDKDPTHFADSFWITKIEHYVSDASQKCVEDATASGAHPAIYCNSPPYFYDYITTRLFIAENTFDTYQINKLGGSKHNCDHPFAYAVHVQGLMTGSLTMKLLQNPEKKDEDGLFAPACLSHGVAFGGPTVDGVEFKEALGNWYFKKGSGPTLLLDNSTAYDQVKSCESLLGMEGIDYL